MKLFENICSAIETKMTDFVFYAQLNSDGLFELILNNISPDIVHQANQID